VVTAVAVMAEIVVSLPRGIVGAVATRFRGVPLVVGATSVNVSVRRHVGITHGTHGTGTGTVLVNVNTTVNEMVHETGTGIAGADAKLRGIYVYGQLVCSLICQPTKTLLHCWVPVGGAP